MGIDFSSRTANRVGWSIVAIIVLLGAIGAITDGNNGHSRRNQKEPMPLLGEIISLKVTSQKDMTSSGVMVEAEVKNITGRYYERIPIRLCARNSHGTIISWDDQVIRTGLPSGQAKFVEYFLDNITSSQIASYTYESPD